jgi:hypothetical protein
LPHPRFFVAEFTLNDFRFFASLRMTESEGLLRSDGEAVETLDKVGLDRCFGAVGNFGMSSYSGGGGRIRAVSATIVRYRHLGGKWLW